MAAKKRQPYRGTQSVLRALAILNTFTDDQPEWSLTDLTKAVGLNRTTTYRLLTALESEGLVTRDPRNQIYRLGPGAVVLGGRARRANPLRKISRPELIKLSEDTGETATLDILDGSYTLTLAEVEGRYVMGMMSSVGSRWPAHASSTGKVLLAHLSADRLANTLEQPLRQLTAHTITNLSRLRQQLAQVREQGYATASDELELGYSDVAAPIFDQEDQVIAALAVGGATMRMTGDKRAAVAKLVRESARRVSRQLGYWP